MTHGPGEIDDLVAAAPAEAFPGARAPMLATAAASLPAGEGWWYEPKLDGYRGLAFVAGDVRLVSRSARSLADQFPAVAAAFSAWPGGPVVLDGEIVAFEDGRPSFGRLQRIGDLPVAARGAVLTYVVFDVLHHGGRDLRPLAYTARRAVLEQLAPFPPGVALNPATEGGGAALFELLCGQGWEGVVAKHGASTYVGRRSDRWQKVKCTARQEFVVLGFTEPQGSRAGFGALVVGVHDGPDLVVAGKVGSGFDHATIAAIDARLRPLASDRPTAQRGVPTGEAVRWVPPLLVIEVAFAEWPAGGHLRHPRFVGFRPDKPAADVVRELPGTNT